MDLAIRSGPIGITYSDEVIEKAVKVSKRGLRSDLLVVALMKSVEVLLSTIDDILCYSGEIGLHVLLRGIILHRRRIEGLQSEFTRKM